ncbi:MAG TPA: type VI secretion system baseplate subunit TssK [Syntrophobacteraceae bacterium]|nr:type VI secretion system baseplate subunit TssK [Syntrophobacteraceae bacterium]
MSFSNRVVWSQGMFILPQHFQQHDRYLENMVNGRCLGLRPYSWGLYSLTVDDHLLKIGKFGLTEISGIFPDGAPFHLPNDDPLPLPVDIPEGIQDEMIFLALPVRRAEAVETDSEKGVDSLARFRVQEREVKDCNYGAEGRAVLQVGSLKTRLMLERDDRSGFACIGLGRVLEMRANKEVELDARYIPSNLNCLATPVLGAFLREAHGILNTRGEMLARDLIAPGHGGEGEIHDFLVLQLINRYQPLVKHFSGMTGLHPEDFFRLLVQLVGELSTFFRDSTRPIGFPTYDHDDLQNTFFPLMEELRDLLVKDRMRRAIQIPLSKPRAGVYVARLPDVNLLDTAVFVLAAKAQVSSETLRSEFPHQVKIGPFEEIRALVASHLRGIPTDPLPVAPKEIPYRTGFTYFELNKHCEHWAKMRSSGGFAIWIGGDFPELTMELWAIREG